MRPRQGVLIASLCLASTGFCRAAGTTAAPFLDIPVGAGPAALGAAYSALAANAYAPTWNPAGLGVLPELEVAAQHVSYVQNTHYEYLSAGMPLPPRRACDGKFWCGPAAVGSAIQYFGSGDIAGLDQFGNPTGDYSTHFAAYNVSYGQGFGDKLSVGVTGKWINAALAGVSANAFALDMGSLYRYRHDLQFAATLMNAGTSLTFLNQGDPLPLALHLAGAYEPRKDTTLSLEMVVPRGNAPSVRMGAQWLPIPDVALRMGYRTDALKGLSPVAGFSGGLGVTVWNQELAYAWVPYGDLGDTHYLSFLMRFGETRHDDRHLIRYKPSVRHAPAQEDDGYGTEYEELKDLINESKPGNKR